MDFLKTPEMRLQDDLKIELVVNEMKAGIRDDIAWVKALKKAAGNEQHATAIYIDERIRRLEDLWHFEKRASLSDIEYQLAQKLAALEKKHKNAKSKVFLFNSWSIPTLLVSILLTGVFLWVGESTLALYVGLFSIFLFIIFANWGSRLEAEQERLKEQIEKTKSPKKSKSVMSKAAILGIIGFCIWYLMR